MAGRRGVPGGRRARVLVVGAGLSGLCCAYELRRAGRDVVVLEARARPGGRVLTLRDFANGQVAEAGGEFVDGSHRLFRRYTARFGLHLDDLWRGRGGLELAYLGGSRVPLADLLGDRGQRDVQRFAERIDRLGAAINPRKPLAAGRRLDERSVASLLDSMALDPLARRVIEHRSVRDEFHVEPDRLSLLFMVAVHRLDSRESERYRVREGNGGLVQGFVESLGESVRLGATVTAIDWSGEQVRVRTEAGPQGETGAEAIEADYCVLSAPLPALRRVAFAPELPGPLAAAVADLQYGAATKTAVQYPRRFWAEQGHSGYLLTDLPVSTAWEATRVQEGRAGILLGYTGGAAARELERLDSAARVRAVAADLGRAFGGRAPDPGRAETVAWANEPHSGGCYAVYAPGQMTAYWAAVRAPHGRLVPAGDHTDAYTGYMEGALRSGRRAAEWVVRKTAGSGTTAAA